MEMTKEHCRKYVGQWVHVHSMYGMHVGILHRTLHDGIILVHHTQLTHGIHASSDTFQPGVHRAADGVDAAQVQFFLPAPGLFVPYAGLFGIWPRPAFFI
ncbi:hypothetical protein GCM10025857_21700 [Alicyclobacillus contaminans]|uniref:hypothetical protein n=1 Tax=Alicyclobacillus contaminans TaxID=392016 RepID=UPI000423CE1F|nr:hypothetical protein [Alicyclobacillus contaminans]GMA50813.1 hypothetical protein GCM10025857_21700 [Alicyclobacillus contaminans]